MAIRIKLDSTAVCNIPMGYAIGWVNATGARIERSAKQMVRVKTGAVRAGIGRKTTRPGGRQVLCRITASHRRSLLEHEGAQPHSIDPRNPGGWLKFYWPKVGEVVYLRHVDHPGTKGSKFLTSPLMLHGTREGFKVTIRRW